MALFGSDAAIRTEVRRVLADFGRVGAGGHVFNLGHGISQFTPPDAVLSLIDEVHTASRAYHA
jgi:uroporphyrinogen decarboxylase